MTDARHSPVYRCPNCGYELAPQPHSQEITCPECGESCTLVRAEISGMLVAEMHSPRAAALIMIGPTGLATVLTVAAILGTSASADALMLGIVYYIAVIVLILGTGLYLFVHRARRPKGVRDRLRLLFLVLCLLFSFSMYVITVWFVIRPAVGDAIPSPP